MTTATAQQPQQQPQEADHPMLCMVGHKFVQGGETAAKFLDLVDEMDAAVWPVSTRELQARLRCCGYDLDNNRLQYIFARRYLSRPKKIAGQYRWSRNDALQVIDALEDLRAWLPTSVHCHKFSPAEHAKFAKQMAAIQELKQRLDQMSVAELIDVVAEAANEETKSFAKTILRQRLGLTD